MNSRHRSAAILIAGIAASTVLVAGCAPSTPEPGSEPVVIDHVHAIVPRGDDVLLVGTHSGILIADRDGNLEGPLGGNGFDSMGLTAVDDVLISSGHPGMDTPAELGVPNLGIIRSDDNGESWTSVAFAGEEDFHVLTTRADGRLYGIGSTSTAIRISDDLGATWRDAASIPAGALATVGDKLYAATPDGLQVSIDDAASFTPVKDAPVLYSLAASGDVLAGVATDGQLWRRAGDEPWTPTGAVDGTVQAIAVTPSGAIALVDERGLLVVDESETTVILPTR